MDKNIKSENVAEIGFMDLLPYGVTVVVLALVLGFGASILADVSNDTTDTGAKAVMSNGTAGLMKMSAKIPIIVTVIVAAVIIGVLITSFYFKSR